jgi:lysophospholipase L1-like esterase
LSDGFARARWLWSRVLTIGPGVLAVCIALAARSMPVVAQSSATGPVVAAWSASPQQSLPGSAQFSNQTVRMVVFPHIAGSAIRVRLSNVFGAQAVSIGQTDVAALNSGAATQAGTDHPLTFAGKPSVTIPAGGEVASDSVAIAAQPNQGLVISVYVPASSGLPTWHQYAQEISYVASGNHAADASSAAYSGTRDMSWWWLDGVDVVAANGTVQASSIVALGDSLTDGLGTGWNTNTRWPDYFSRRLLAQYGNQASVVNEGISGNRVLADSPCYGQSGLGRLNRDVLAQPGVGYVIVYEGINDLAGAGQRGSICSGPVPTNASASQLIGGYQQIIATAHQHGLKTYGATLTPFQNSVIYTSDAESQRQAVNQWVRTSKAFDAVLDFDAAVRNPSSQGALLSTYDSGDHLHLNAAGYQALANSINLSLFSSASASSTLSNTATPTATPTRTSTPVPASTATRVPTPTMTPVQSTNGSSAIFVNGFESGDFSGWTSTVAVGSGTRSVSATAPYSGRYAGVFSRNTSNEVGDQARAVEHFSPPTGKVAWARAWVRFDSIPSAWYPNIDNALQLDDGSNLNHPKARFGAHLRNRLFFSYLKKDGTWYQADWSTALTPGTYYGLKIKFDASAPNPVITWYVNSGSGWASVASYTDTSGGTLASPNEIRVGTALDLGIAIADPQYAGAAQNRVDQVAVSPTDPG